MLADEELLAQWRAGDSRAGDQLLTRHFDSICRFFRAKLSDGVDDLIQQTFLDAVKSRDRIGDGGFRAYLFGIARHRLYDRLRQELRSPQHVDIGSMSLADLGTTPTQALVRSQRQQLLMAALRTVAVEQQIVLELAYWEGMSAKEIAVVLGANPNTVRSRLVRAREALRQAFEVLSLSPMAIEETMEELDQLLSQG